MSAKNKLSKTDRKKLEEALYTLGWLYRQDSVDPREQRAISDTRTAIYNFLDNY